MPIILVLVFSILLIVAPIGANIAHHPLGTATQALLMSVGALLASASGFLLAITNLYVKTKASEAFVRTGMGGLLVVKDGGAFVIPVVHQKVVISLETFRLEVKRQGASDALITKDKLRADISAEFFLRVTPTVEDIGAAARSFGERMTDIDYVKTLIEDKLISALRTVAATKTIEQLNVERDDFMKRVTEIISPDLQHNGLTLETATISKLDQTDPKTLRDDNIFDAQGKRTISEITQAQLTDRNKLEREGEQARASQDLETKKKLLAFDQERAEVMARQQAAIHQVTAEQDRAAKEAEINAQRAIELANVTKTEQVAVAGQKQEQALEVAQRVKEQAVAEAESNRVKAQEALATAEAKREAALQSVEMVKVTGAAERTKAQRVINANAEAEADYVKSLRTADAKAYGIQKDAEGRQAAATADAAAITQKANAEAAAQEAKAKGEKALAMVPVQVEGERVTIEKRRIEEVEGERVAVEKRRIEEVLVPELTARDEHGKAAQDFQLAQLSISKNAEVKIETARATATLMAGVHANLQLFGTPEDAAKMTNAWMNGMNASGTVEGFVENAGDKTLEGLKSILEEFRGLLPKAPEVKK